MKIQKWDEINGSGSSRERMEAFLSAETDTYAILQLRFSEETSSERFESLERLHEQGKEPQIDHYEVVYTVSHISLSGEHSYILYSLDQWLANRTVKYVYFTP